jgi:hypothetical protein
VNYISKNNQKKKKNNTKTKLPTLKAGLYLAPWPLQIGPLPPGSGPSGLAPGRSGHSLHSVHFTLLPLPGMQRSPVRQPPRSSARWPRPGPTAGPVYTQPPWPGSLGGMWKILLRDAPNGHILPCRGRSGPRWPLMNVDSVWRLAGTPALGSQRQDRHCERRPGDRMSPILQLAPLPGRRGGGWEGKLPGPGSWALSSSFRTRGPFTACSHLSAGLRCHSPARSDTLGATLWPPGIRIRNTEGVRWGSLPSLATL